MINDPKDISEILKELDNVTFEQLDKAIQSADRDYGLMQYNFEDDIYNLQSEFNTIENNSYKAIESQQIELLPEFINTINFKQNYISQEEEESKKWMKEPVLAA